MPKKTTPTEPVIMTEEPVTETPAEATPSWVKPEGWEWPESSETRMIVEPFTEAELAVKAQEMSKVIQEREAIAVRKKNIAKTLQGQIDEKDEKLADFSAQIEAKGTEKKVDCHWIFECGGFDSEGTKIDHPNLKQLVRSDTLEPVGSAVPITDEERQLSLHLAVPEQPEEEQDGDEPDDEFVLEEGDLEEAGEDDEDSDDENEPVAK